MLPGRSFIKVTLGAPTGVDVEALKAENDNLRAKLTDLESKLDEANKKVCLCPDPTSEPKHTV